MVRPDAQREVIGTSKVLLGSQLLRLQTLGGVVILDDAGRPLHTAALTRRSLALLAVVATAGDRGASRDQLVALFWPETHEERARHSLTQALYAARRALHLDDLFLGTSDIRLNPALITSDIAEFKAAIAARDFERAAAVYRGPFLDGFFVPGATPDLEQWISGSRVRYEDQLVAVLEQLGADAESAGDDRRVEEVWRRLAELRPLDSRVCASLMRAMLKAGNRAGALQAARAHEDLLRRELDIAPDASVRDLAARIAEEPIEAEYVAEARSDAAAASTVAPARWPALASWRTRMPRRWRLGAVLLAVAIAVAATGLRVRARDSRPMDIPRLQQRLIIAPFRVAGASPALEYLRLGTIELLASRLSDYGSEHLPDRGAMLQAWRQTGMGRDASVPRRTLLSVATRMGGERVVIGTVIGSRERLIVEAHMVSLPGGDLVASATARGPADSIGAVMDRLASRLLLAELRESPPERGNVPRNDAVRAFVAAEDAARRGAYRAARIAYQDAIRIDTTFALAALRLALAAEAVGDVHTARRAAAVAWTSRDHLFAVHREELEHLVGPRYPMPSTVAEQLDAWQMPSADSAWNYSQFRWPREQQSDTRWPIDSASSAEVDPLVSWRRAVAAADTAVLAEIRASFPRLRVATLRSIALNAQYAGDAADASAAIRAWLDRANDPVERDEAMEAYHSLVLNTGRRDASIDSALASRPPSAFLVRARARLRVLDAIYGSVAPDSAAMAASVLESRVARLAARPSPSEDARREGAADRCVLAQWRLAHGDTLGVTTMMRALDTDEFTAGAYYAAEPRSCSVLLRAWLAVRRREQNARAVLDSADQLAFTAYSAGDAALYTPLLLARLHAQLANRELALRALRRQGFMSGWPRYLAAMRREERRLR